MGAVTVPFGTLFAVAVHPGASRRPLSRRRGRAIVLRMSIDNWDRSPRLFDRNAHASDDPASVRATSGMPEEG